MSTSVSGLKLFLFRVDPETSRVPWRYVILRNRTVNHMLAALGCPLTDYYPVASTRRKPGHPSVWSQVRSRPRPGSLIFNQPTCPAVRAGLTLITDGDQQPRHANNHRSTYESQIFIKPLITYVKGRCRVHQEQIVHPIYK